MSTWLYSVAGSSVQLVCVLLTVWLNSSQRSQVTLIHVPGSNFEYWALVLIVKWRFQSYLKINTMIKYLCFGSMLVIVISTWVFIIIFLLHKWFRI